MRAASNYGFVIQNEDVRNGILIPRYYDPRLIGTLESLNRDHTLVSIRDLVANHHLVHDQGDYVPKIHYGSGPYPYIRTSDLANWELKASPKHGVAQEVFARYSAQQDVQPDDILFVHEGTYLIGSAAIVTPYEGPLLFQHHLARFRVLSGSPVGPYYLLAALESPIVQQQIRSKQFSADIIDSIVGRLGEVEIPIPRSLQVLQSTETRVKEAVLERAEIRERLAYNVRELDAWLRGEAHGTLDDVLSWKPVPLSYAGTTSFLGERRAFVAFQLNSDDIKNDILLPKYYDPRVISEAKAYEPLCDLVSIGALRKAGALAASTGDEVGKMSYGSGSIPFLRTSDLGSWELKRNPKQGVSKLIYGAYEESQDLAAGDILLVRDGTYLVGSSILTFQDDLPALFCGGLVKIRALEPKKLPRGLLFALLNLPFVRQQMRNKQFTRDVIDTLGNRVDEILLPIPRDIGLRNVIGTSFMELLGRRNSLRGELRQLVDTLYPTQSKGS